MAAIALTQHRYAESSALGTTVVVDGGAGWASSAGGCAITLSCAAGGSRTIVSVSDNVNGTAGWTAAANTAVVNTPNAVFAQGWYHLNPGAGVTSITVTFSGAASTDIRECFAQEWAGLITPAFDLGASEADKAQSPPGTCSGATITTHSASGVVIGLIFEIDTITSNPASGNEFTAGGDLGTYSAVCTLISTSAASHRPVWTDGTDAFSTFTYALVSAGTALMAQGWM